MQALILFFSFLSLAVALENVIQVPLKHHSIHGDVLKRQVKKLGRAARHQSVGGQKLFETVFKNDYVSAEISLGTPPQPFTVTLSSGTTKLWVLDENYRLKTNTQHAYQPSKSSTSKKTAIKFNEKNGSFKFINGIYYTDTLKFGNITIKAQPFGSANATHGWDKDLWPVDGSLGLFHLINTAYSKVTEPAAPIDNMVKVVDKSIVTIFLDKQVAPSKGHSNGLVTVGGFDTNNCLPKAATELLAYSDYDVEKRLQLQFYSFGYKNIESAGAAGYAVFDTSSSSVMLQIAFMHDIFGKIKPVLDYSVMLYTVKCDRVKKDLEKLNIVFGHPGGNNPKIDISPQNYLVDLDLKDGMCALAFETTDESNYDDDTYVLGTPVFRELCWKMDIEKNTIQGFPHKKQ